MFVFFCIMISCLVQVFFLTKAETDCNMPLALWNWVFLGLIVFAFSAKVYVLGRGLKTGGSGLAAITNILALYMPYVIVVWLLVGAVFVYFLTKKCDNAIKTLTWYMVTFWLSISVIYLGCNYLRSR